MKKEILKFLILLLVAAGAGPAGAAIWQWSTTSSNNATADPSINWSEGQAPSSINDSARAMMAAIAAFRNDISAVNTTAGTSTAYTLTTSEGVNTTPSNGQMISFIANVANGASPTLTVDGGNTYPLWMFGSSITGGTLVAGSPYRVAFSLANSAWLLEAGYTNAGTPLGGILWSTAPSAPSSNFVAPSGQCISTTTYATYWVQQGSPASGSCAGGQFQIIDMRGKVPAALDTLNSSAANLLTNSATGCGTAMTSVGAICANGIEGSPITLAQVPTGITVQAPAGKVPYGFFDGFAPMPSTGTNYAPYSTSVAGLGLTTNLTSNNTSGNVRPNVMPTIGLIPYLRIL